MNIYLFFLSTFDLLLFMLVSDVTVEGWRHGHIRIMNIIMNIMAIFIYYEQYVLNYLLYTRTMPRVIRLARLMTFPQYTENEQVKAYLWPTQTNRHNGRITTHCPSLKSLRVLTYYALSWSRAIDPRFRYVECLYSRYDNRTPSPRQK